MTTTTIEKALERLAKETAKANASASKTAKDETAKALSFERQADQYTEQITSFDTAWSSGDEGPQAADRALAVAERDRAQKLADGRQAAANRAKASLLNEDSAAAQVVARAIAATIDNAYPVHAVAIGKQGQEAPVPNRDETPCIIVAQREPAKRIHDGSLSGTVDVQVHRPTWAAAIDWAAVESAARRTGAELRVPDTTFDPEPEAIDGIISQGFRVTVVRGSEDLPLIPELERDQELVLDAVQPVLAHLAEDIDDRLYGVRVEVGERKKLPQDGQSVGVQISFRRQVVPVERRMSQGVRERLQDEAEDRANRIDLMGEKPAGKIFRKSDGPEAKAAFQQVASETVGTFLPGIGVVSEVTTDIIDVKSGGGSMGHQHGYSRYVINLRAVSRQA